MLLALLFSLKREFFSTFCSDSTSKLQNRINELQEENKRIQVEVKFFFAMICKIVRFTSF